MPSGIRIKLDNGKVYDSNSTPIVFYESFSINGGAQGFKEYKQLAGFTLYVAITKQTSVVFENLSYYSITYNLGYPVLNWFPYRMGGTAIIQTFLIFAR